MDIRWCNLTWPRESNLIMGLLCDRCHCTRYTNSIRPHCDNLRFTVLIEHCEIKSLGIFAAQLEDMADLNRAIDNNGRITFWAEITSTDFSSFDIAIDFKVTTISDESNVLILRIRASNPMRTYNNTWIGVDRDAELLRILRSDIPLH